MIDINTDIKTKGRLIRISYFRDESDLDLLEPEIIIEKLKGCSTLNSDVFTFHQRLPDTTPKFPYYQEWHNIAALEYKDHRYWFEKILDSKTRNMIRKAA